jgi:hypothetical protein
MYIIFIFIIIIIIYLFGISIIEIIENKLNNIKLNIEYPINSLNKISSESLEHFDINQNNTNNTKNEDKNKDKNKDKNENKNENNSNQKINFNTNFDTEYYNQMSKDNRISGFSNSPDEGYKGWSIDKKKIQTCIKNHTHRKDGKDINCNYGSTNYADPKDMSEMDLRIFILNYPSNLTLQDYINWLYCFIGKEDRLPYNHLKNLEKLKTGIELVEEEGILPPPGYYYPQLTAEDYFKKMYNNETNEFSTAPPLNSNTASMLGYNYNDYSEFSQNSDLYGSTGKIRNPDIALKKNAKKLRDYVQPKDSNSLNIEKSAEIYHVKNVEV